MNINTRSTEMSDVQRDLSGPRQITVRLQFVYGMGHILNDICASMWFTYLLVYFQSVLGFGAKQAGLVLLVGQVADALATPFVGFHSDTSHPSVLCNYGRRKTWHLFGTVCVIGAFPFIFSPCIGCDGTHKWAQLVYYSAFVVIFQIGWAAVQVSHLSLIPEISPDEHDRTHLTAVRYSFTVFSNVLVYVVTWIVLHITSESDQQIGPDDAYKFHQVVAVGISVGAVTSLLFHCLLREPTPSNILCEASPLLQSSSSDTAKPASHKGMLKSMMFYQVGVIYMCTRLFVNLTQIFTPLYLHKTLALPGVTLASVPLVMYLSSFLTSLAVRPINRILGRKGAYILGAIVCISGCILIYFANGSFYSTYGIYGVVIVFGAGGALILVTSLSFTTVLIGNATNTAAFVYGAMSFTDKLANGLAVILIEHLAEDADSDFYRKAVSYGCGGAAIVAVLAVLSLRSQSIVVPTEEEDSVTNSINS